MASYPREILDPNDDDGTMVRNVEELSQAVVGHKIVSAEKVGDQFIIELDNGTIVELHNSWDCCASTELYSFLLNVDNIDHMIMGVGTTDKYTTWHIYADFGDIMEMQVGWSCGNPFYYGYGFDIKVQERDPDEKMIWIEIPESVVLNAVDPDRQFTMSDGGAFRRACRQVAEKLGLV